MKNFYRKVGFLALFGISIASTVLASSDIASLPVNLGVSNITGILYIVAFLGGALMILTPCSAATIPAYFANAFGGKGNSKGKITQRTIIFFFGFSAVYAFMGGGASLVGRWLNLYQEQLAVISGILLIAFGLLMLAGKAFCYIPLKKDGKEQTKKGTFLFGTLFAVGFSGCAGPILAGILTIAASLTTTQAVLLMFFYSLGMGVPLVLLSLVFDKYNVLEMKFFKWSKSFKVFGKTFYLSLPNLLSGILLIALGLVFLLFQTTSALSATFPQQITDVGYGLQDWLLSLNIPPALDVLIFLLLGYVGIKFIAKRIVNEKGEIALNLDKKKIRSFFLVVAIIFFVGTQIAFFSKKADIKKQEAIIAENSRPANIDIFAVTSEDCIDCFDINQSIEVIKSENVKISSEQIYSMDSDEGRQLLKEYNIKTVPALVIKGEVTKGDSLKKLFEQAGTIDGDIFVARSTPPPYIDVETGEVLGRFKVTFLVDEKCEDCYDIELHRRALSNLGMVLNDQETVDISSDNGRNLVNKYKIAQVPTIILTGDIEEYPVLKNAWDSVGSIENDGAYIFRSVDLMGIYRDLKTNEIVNPKEKTEDVQG